MPSGASGVNRAMSPVRRSGEAERRWASAVAVTSGRSMGRAPRHESSSVEEDRRPEVEAKVGATAVSRAFGKEIENNGVELPDRPISPHRNPKLALPGIEAALTVSRRRTVLQRTRATER